MREALQELAQLKVGKVSFGVPLRQLSRWRIGGPADLLVEPGSIDQVQTVAVAVHRLQLPHVIVGEGSNLLFDDAGVRGVVVKIGRTLSRVSIDGGTVTAEAGVFVPCLVRRIAAAGLSGIEHAIGIPGTLGGLVLMNGGSLRKNIGSNVERVWAVNGNGEVVEYDRPACRFAYRYSALQQQEVIVVKVRLCCPCSDSRTSRREMLEIMSSRRHKFPLKQPNCGSVFLSDPAMYENVGPPGKVIEACGFKGFRIGDAMVPHKHANFIVNLGHARSTDVLEIIGRIQYEVQKHTGFHLRCEVRYVSPEGRVFSADQALNKR